MGGLNSTLSDRQAVWAFVLGCVAVTIGMCAHLPMLVDMGLIGHAAP